MRKNKIKEDLWLQGYVCACSILARDFIDDSGEQLMKEGNFTKQDAVNANCEPNDIRAIYRMNEKLKKKYKR